MPLTKAEQALRDRRLKALDAQPRMRAEIERRLAERRAERAAKAGA